MVRDKEHRTLPFLHPLQHVDQAVQQVVGIADGVVVGIHQHPHVLLALLHVSRHGLEHLELLRIFVGILRTVTGARVQHYQHLVLFARGDALPQSLHQNAVVADVLARVLLTHLFVRQVFVDMYRRLSPVRGAPRHVHTRSEGIVGQQLVQVVAYNGFQYRLGTCRGVGGT